MQDQQHAVSIDGTKADQRHIYASCPMLSTPARNKISNLQDAIAQWSNPLRSRNPLRTAMMIRCCPSTTSFSSDPITVQRNTACCLDTKDARKVPTCSIELIADTDSILLPLCEGKRISVCRLVRRFNCLQFPKREFLLWKTAPSNRCQICVHQDRILLLELSFQNRPS